MNDLPEPIIEEDNIDILKAKLSNLENENTYLRGQVEDLSITVELGNERWIKAINELSNVELELRKLKKRIN